MTYKSDPVPETRSAWQFSQGKACSCRGADEYCPCQNTERATMPSNPTPAEGVVVPVEPTEEMLIAGAAAVRDFYSAKGPYARTRAMWTAMLAARPAAPTQSAAQTGEACRCSRCVNEAVAAEGGSGFDTRLMQMFLCTQCGNKRCPHATDHRLSCTNSNEAGQEGSSYGPPLYRRDQATLIEAQAAEIEGLTARLDLALGNACEATGGAHAPMMQGKSYWFCISCGESLDAAQRKQSQRRAFLASRTERADG